MRQLIDYLPPVIAETLEMQGIMAAEQPQIEKLWDASDFVLDELYILSATDIGLRRWERILGLSSSGTVEHRRQVILLELMKTLPYTHRTLESYLQGVLGDVLLSIDYGNYGVSIETGAENEQLLASLYDQLRLMIPANMTLFLEIMEEHYFPIYSGCLMQVTDTIEVI